MRFFAVTSITVYENASVTHISSVTEECD